MRAYFADQSSDLFSISLMDGDQMGDRWLLTRAGEAEKETSELNLQFDSDVDNRIVIRFDTNV